MKRGMRAQMVSICRKAGSVITCLCIMSFLLCGCGQETEEDRLVVVEQEEQEPIYSFATVTVGDVQKTTRVTCTYRQIQGQSVSFSLSGKVVEKVYVKEGDVVKRGELLAELSGGNLEDEIERLEYEVARNELLLSYLDVDQDYEISAVWLNYLYRSGRSDYDEESRDQSVKSIQQNYQYMREDYEDALEMDRLLLEKYQKEARQSRVYAQMDGIVYEIQEDLEGSTSMKGETVMTIVDNSQCVFETEVPEYAKLFQEGQKIQMSIAYGTGVGQYILIPWHMEEWGEKQLFSVLEGPENEGIEVGTLGTMQLVLEKREQVLTVPALAVSEADGRAFVYVQGEGNMREVKWVETGLYGDSVVEITAGLAEGDRVILK